MHIVLLELCKERESIPYNYREACEGSVEVNCIQKLKIQSDLLNFE